MTDVTVICSGRGTHKVKTLGHLSVGISSSSVDHTERKFVDMRVSDSKTQKAKPAAELVAKYFDPINDRRSRPLTGRVYRFQCPTCGRDWQRRNDPLVEVIETLQAAGIYRLDVSYM